MEERKTLGPGEEAPRNAETLYLEVMESMGSIWFSLVIIVVLALANGFFAASEIAVVSARRGRLQQRAAAGDRKAAIALELAEEPSRFLATIQIGITLVGTLAAVYGGDALADPLSLMLAPHIGTTAAEEVALLLVVLMVSYISLIVGELVPKRLALQHAEGVATFSAPLMQIISRFTAPLVWFLSISAQGILRLFGAGTEKEEQITEEDILSMVREGAEKGTVEVAEREIIERLFEFSDASVRSIMIPRTEIVAMPVESSIDDAIRLVLSSGHSRLPVYEGGLDNIRGVLYMRDLLAARFNLAAGREMTVADLLQEPVVVLEQQHVSEVLQHFKNTGTQMALVVDEHGQIEGLVTVEDFLTTLTGYIPAGEEEEADIVRRPDGSYLVDGMLPYVTAARRIGLPAREPGSGLPEFETVAGLMLALLRHIPVTGERTVWRGWCFEIIDLDGRRIDKVLITRQEELEDGTDPRSRNEAILATGAIPVPPEQRDEKGGN